MICALISMPGRGAPVVVLSLLVLQGCAPISMFQSPEVLQPGERAIGAAYLVVQWDTVEEEDLPGDDDVGGLPSIWFRTAVAENTDMGMSIGLFSSALDIKRVFVRGPVLLSGDLGLCFGNDEFDGDAAVTLRPALLLGTEHLYGSVWGAYAFPGDDTVVAQGVGVGVSLGDRVRLVGEWNYFQMGDTDSPSLDYGGGLQWTWGGRRVTGE
jgi:hypothetical protein